VCVIIAGVEILLWPEWSDALLGFAEALAIAALTVGLAIRTIAFGIGPQQVNSRRSPWLEILTAAFLVHLFWRTGLTPFYAWNLNWELSAFEELSLYIMLGIAFRRLSRSTR
jgi:hypothetical protein